MCACALLGIVAASGRDGDGYALIGVGFLGAVAPFTALASQALGQDTSRRSRRHTVWLTGWTVLAGVSAAVVGYILADVGSIAFEKIPTRLQ
jgi:opacity protein-like surface antigen